MFEEESKIVKIFNIKKEIADSKITNLKKQNFENINFLYESIQDEIYFYELDENRKIYSFFGIYFLVINTQTIVYDNKKQNELEKQNLFKYHKDFQSDDEKYKNDEYFAYLFNKEQNDEVISMATRNSKALVITDKNLYDNLDLKAVFDTKTLVVCPKLNVGCMDKFNRFIILFILALAYNEKITQFFKTTYLSYNDNNFNEMLKIRDEILSFDLKCYFDNPVKPTSNQTYEIWKILSTKLAIRDTHNELKSQISDLTQVIYNTKKDRQERKFTIFGIVIAALSLMASIVVLIK